MATLLWNRALFLLSLFNVAHARDMEQEMPFLINCKEIVLLPSSLHMHVVTKRKDRFNLFLFRFKSLHFYEAR